MCVTFRPVVPGDQHFLFQLYASSRELEMAQVPWTEAEKQAFLEMQFRAQIQSYASMYPQAAHLVICDGPQPVGRLYIDRSGDRFRILDITIAPAYRNRGIGSEVLSRFLNEATDSGKPANIYVETFNPSVRLFTRLGFRPIQEDGFQLLLERAPAASS